MPTSRPGSRVIRPAVLVLVVAALVLTPGLVPGAVAPDESVVSGPFGAPDPAGLPAEPGVDPIGHQPPLTGPVGDSQLDSTGRLAELWPCQLPQAASRSDIGVGFPTSSRRAPSTGTVNVTALFVDFADRRATGTTTDRLEAHWPQAEEYLQAQSYGRLDITMRAHKEWLHLSGAETAYALDDGITNSEARAYIAEAVGLADPDFDFTGTDIVWMIPPSGTVAIGTVAYLGVLSPITAEAGATVIDNVVIRGNGWSNGISDSLDGDELVAVHETLHTMGLVDLYRYNADTYADQNAFVGNFDPMGSILGYPQGTWSNPGSAFLGRETMAWHRWQLGWIDDDQIRCQDGTAPVEAVELTSLSAAGGAKALVEQVDTTHALVAEARVAAGYDGAAARSGVLVYSVDSSIASGSGPIRVLGDYPNYWASAAVLLMPGERLDTAGRRVQVHAELGADTDSELSYMVGMAKIGDTDGSGVVDNDDVATVLADLVGADQSGYLGWAGDLDGGGRTGLTDARILAQCLARGVSPCVAPPAP